jgi:hypothetical protein
MCNCQILCLNRQICNLYRSLRCINFIKKGMYIILATIIIGLGVRTMVFNSTVNSISAILRQSVLLVDEAGVPRENHRPVTSH